MVLACAGEPDQIEDGQHVGRLQERVRLEEGDFAARVVDALDGAAPSIVSMRLRTSSSVSLLPSIRPYLSSTSMTSSWHLYEPCGYLWGLTDVYI